MLVHDLEGLKLDVDRGPNWLFVKLSPQGDLARDVPEFAERLMSIASRHFIYRLVLELDELKTLPPALIDQLSLLQDRLAECDGALRLCGLSPKCAEALRKRGLESVLPNHATRQAAVLGSDVAPLRQKMKEVVSGACGEGADAPGNGPIWQKPCLQ